MQRERRRVGSDCCWVGAGALWRALRQYNEFCELPVGEDADEEDCESGPADELLESKREESDRLGPIMERIESLPGMSTPSEVEVMLGSCLQVTQG